MYAIHITDDAEEDLAYYRPYERKQIIDGIVAQLSYEPMIPTGNRKQLRANPIATWELRIGRYRVFYEVETADEVVPGEAVAVIIVSVGHKEHNVLYVRGKVVKL